METGVTGWEDVDVFVGVDVGKSEHHAVALDRGGKRLFDRALPNDEGRLRTLIADLKRLGRVLLVVDQPATIGALPIAVAHDEGVLVGYLPGLAMRRIADLHPGEAKTDARDAAIIATAARSMPHALRSIQLADEQVAELTMLCGFDDDRRERALEGMLGGWPGEPESGCTVSRYTADANSCGRCCDLPGSLVR